MLAVTAYLLTVLAPSPPTPVALGITDLLSTVEPVISYRIDGHEPVELGLGWSGFDIGSGVYWQPELPSEGRRPWFAHCPWRQGPGETYADWRLTLPQTTVIKLRVDYGLRQGSRGDGVRYTVLVDGQQLWADFSRATDWRTAEVDLSAYAGRTITLRLQVDPGPERKTADDWSRWGVAELACGTPEQITAAKARAEEQARMARLADFKAAGDDAERDLTEFASGQTNDLLPDAAGPVDTTVAKDGDAYVFTCRGSDQTVVYRLDPQTALAGLTVTINGETLDPQPFSTTTYLELGGEETSGDSRSIEWLGEQAGTVRWRETYRRAGSDDAAHLEFACRAVGYSLDLHLQAAEPKFTGYEITARGDAIAAPFGFGLQRRHPSGVYLAACADLWLSDASGLSPAAARTAYGKLTDGTRRTMRDRFTITVSGRYEEVLPNLTPQPSPFLKDLAGRCVLDVWSTSFAEDDAWLEAMAGYGVTDCLLIKHVWQRDGYDRTYPNVFPAMERLGGDTGLKALADTAKRLGHRFCVHENFYDYYPNAEAYKPEDRALRADGTPIPGWDRGPIKALFLKPSKLMDYAREFSPEVVKRYGADAAYHDIMPNWHVDYDAKAPGGGMLRTTQEANADLFDYDRELYHGPVVCEAVGNRVSGIYDGGCNYGQDSWATTIAPDFELLKIHPKMSNHGIGYYERWLPWGYGPGWHGYLMTDRERDHYRAMTIAFGRTGFLGHQLMQDPHATVREYHLMQAFARAYTGQPLTQLAYFVTEGDWSGWIDAGTAAKYGRYERLRATFAGGQQVYVNFSAASWDVGEATLPQWGVYTSGPRATAGTVLKDGQIVDFARYDDIAYADARSHQWLPSEPPPAIQPTVAGWQDLGDGKLSLTLAWQVGRQIERDVTVFWHFKVGSKIIFQADHRAKLPTSQWPVGGTATDGPRTVQVPIDAQDTEYDLVVGLYDKAGRVATTFGADETGLAKLRVVREGGEITKVTLEPVPLTPPPGAEQAPYLVGANRGRQVIDFGDLATNGAIVRWKDRLRPVPAGEAMEIGLPGEVRPMVNGQPQPRTRRDGKVWFSVPAGAEDVTIER